MAKRIQGQLLDGLLNVLEEPAMGLDRAGTVRFFTSKFAEFYPKLCEGEVLWNCLDSDPLVRWVSDCLDSTEPEVREQIMTHRDSELWLARLDPVVVDSGRCAGWIVRLKDIQPVERLSERLDRLLVDVRQGLSEPLASMKTRLELLLEGGHKDPELTVELLRQLNDDSNRLARLLFSLEGGEPEAVAVELSMEGSSSATAVASKVHQTFEPLARAKNLALKLDIDSGACSTNSVSEAEMERCLVNLVDNAVKYTALNGYGEVLIKASPGTDGGILFSVDDSGPGIPEAHFENVFDQFFRLTEGPTAQLGGTGLGLWRVRQTTELREGRVWVEGSSKGGAGLRLWFPS